MQSNFFKTLLFAALLSIPFGDANAQTSFPCQGTGACNPTDFSEGSQAWWCDGQALNRCSTSWYATCTTTNGACECQCTDNPPPALEQKAKPKLK